MTEVVIEQLEPLVVATIRHDGPHDPRSTDDAWDRLILWASPRRLLGRRFDVRGVGLLWDDPRMFAADERRYDVGVPVDPEDAAEIERPAFITVTMPGQYLKVTHRGDYAAIGRTYDMALGTTMRYEGYELAAAPMIELYRNSPAEVGEDDLMTDIFIPVVRL
jgi:AraC family transcriptional regulator